jgi:dTDP-4-dehydrorhamnose 3,5-epimerase
VDASKFVIIGANGQLGKALQAKYPEARAVDSNQLDITDQKSLAAFDWSNVSHILNAAAYTNVDGAETDEGRRAAWAVNSTGVGHLAEIADDHEITLVHISSDYVFDGSENNHEEGEPLSPLSVYGASKAAGDIAASLVHEHYILRASWVIGEGKNFVRTMMGLAEKNISPTVVHDQVGRLTFTSELVRAIDHLLSGGAQFGVYNVTNGGDPASWADITRKIFEIIGRDDLRVTDTTTAEYFAGKEGIAPRPLRSTLDLAKIQATGFESTDWQADLEKYIKGEDS